MPDTINVMMSTKASTRKVMARSRPSTQVTWAVAGSSWLSRVAPQTVVAAGGTAATSKLR